MRRLYDYKFHLHSLLKLRYDFIIIPLCFPYHSANFKLRQYSRQLTDIYCRSVKYLVKVLCSLLQQINYRLAVHIQLYSNFIFFDGIPAESKYYVVRRNSYRSLQLLYLFVAPNARNIPICLFCADIDKEI